MRDKLAGKPRSKRNKSTGRQAGRRKARLKDKQSCVQAGIEKTSSRASGGRGKPPDRQLSRYAGRQADRPADMQPGRQADKKTGRQVDIQADTQETNRRRVLQTSRDAS